jgi:hypothetical protein
MTSLSRQLNMLIDGTKTRVTKWIHGDLCVVRVDVDAILPGFDPTEPYLEPAVVKFLDQLQEMANNGRIDELAQHGRVYIGKTA